MDSQYVRVYLSFRNPRQDCPSQVVSLSYTLLDVERAYCKISRRSVMMATSVRVVDVWCIFGLGEGIHGWLVPGSGLGISGWWLQNAQNIECQG